MRKINSDIIKEKVKELCLKANVSLPEDVEKSLRDACDNETSCLGKYALDVLKENMDIAKEKQIPLCQDTGMVIVFLEIGQDIVVEGELINDAVNEGIRQSYDEGFFRKSVVDDPILRQNTKDNTPAVIYTDIIAGDKIKISIMPKGFGSENMGRIFMLKPSDGVEGIKDCVVKAVIEAGPNPCPPLILGVGIGGTMEKAGMLSKKALLRKIGDYNSFSHIKDLEQELLELVNKTNVGPEGLGGDTTAFAVNVEVYPTHIAGLPVAISFACNCARHVEVII